MNIEVKDIAGKKIKSVTLSPEIFSVEMKEHVLHLAVKAYRANMRQGTHATKTKAMVAGGGKKPFKQKGTGEARQGSTRSPLNPGGGVSHGPQPRNYHEKVNRNAKRVALSVALSDRAKNGKVVVIDDLKIAKANTKQMAIFVKGLKLTGKSLIVDERKDDFLYLSARNIYGVSSTSPSKVTAADVLRFDNLILTENALNALQQRFKGV
jgi:large subunit ribosomal protein L4